MCRGGRPASGVNRDPLRTPERGVGEGRRGRRGVGGKGGRGRVRVREGGWGYRELEEGQRVWVEGKEWRREGRYRRGGGVEIAGRRER